MKKSFCICLAAILSGCATARLKTGSAIASAGQNIGKTGTVTLAGSASLIPPLLIPVGVAIGVPMWIVGAALYYPGCLLSGEEIESDAFEM